MSSAAPPSTPTEAPIVSNLRGFWRRVSQGDFLASEATRQIELADGLCEHPGNSAQHLVACLMAEAIVDGLEVVDIRDDKGEVRVEAPRVLDLVVEAFVQRPPVGEVRQRIGLRLAGHPCQIR